MSKFRVRNYTFNKINKQITLTDYTSVNDDDLMFIFNKTVGVILYDNSDKTKLGTVAGNVITLDFDTNTNDFNNSDILLIYIDAKKDTDGKAILLYNDDADVVNGNITANNQNVTHSNLKGYVGAYFLLFNNPIFTGITVVFEMTVDNWNTAIPILTTRLDSASNLATSFTTLGTNSAFYMHFPTNVGSNLQIRIRNTAYGSGTMQVKICPTMVTPPTVCISNITTLPTVVARKSVNAADGARTYHVRNSTAGTNAVSVKPTGGQQAKTVISNNSASVRWFKLFNKASAPIPGTDIPVQNYMLKPNDNFTVPDNNEVGLSLGIAYAITAGIALNDATPIGADEVVVNMVYT